MSFVFGRIATTVLNNNIVTLIFKRATPEFLAEDPRHQWKRHLKFDDSKVLVKFYFSKNFLDFEFEFTGFIFHLK